MKFSLQVGVTVGRKLFFIFLRAKQSLPRQLVLCITKKKIINKSVKVYLLKTKDISKLLLLYCHSYALEYMNNNMYMFVSRPQENVFGLVSLFPDEIFIYPRQLVSNQLSFSGDHVAVYPINDSNLVDRLGQLTGADLDEVFSLINTDQESTKKHPFPCPTSYRTALSHYVEITAMPRTHILRELVEYCSDEEVGDFCHHIPLLQCFFVVTCHIKINKYIKSGLESRL